MKRLIIKFVSFFIPFKGKRTTLGFKYELLSKFITWRKPYNIKGKNNKIILIKDGNEFVLSKFERIKGLRITVRGNDNIIRISFPNEFCATKIILLGNGNFFEIGETKHKIKKMKFNMALSDNRKFIIGKDFSCESGAIVSMANNSNIIIGDGCMFADEVLIRNSDGHVIMDGKGNIININNNISIGNHVWLGVKTTVLKSSVIPNNCIVGACSLVVGKFEESNCAIGGIPAKLLKSNLHWLRDSHYSYEKKISV